MDFTLPVFVLIGYVRIKKFPRRDDVVVLNPWAGIFRTTNSTQEIDRLHG